MTDAILTNPYHVDGVAADLDRALRAGPDERLSRYNALRHVVWEDTASAWARHWREALHGPPQLQVVADSA
jgi:trehalose-6-phosphate synthase